MIPLNSVGDFISHSRMLVTTWAQQVIPTWTSVSTVNDKVDRFEGFDFIGEGRSKHLDLARVRPLLNLHLEYTSNPHFQTMKSKLKWINLQTIQNKPKMAKPQILTTNCRGQNSKNPKRLSPNSTQLTKGINIQTPED